jgi:L,D-transpeptidase catalytic domain
MLSLHTGTLFGYKTNELEFFKCIQKNGGAMKSFFKSAQIGVAVCSFLSVLSCGQNTNSMGSQEEGSEVLGVVGTGQHEVCAVEVNVRDSANIDKISFVATQGEKIQPLGTVKNHIGLKFQLVKFVSSGKQGFVADNYLCKTGTVAQGAPKIEVNLTTNRLSFFRGNQLVRSWNVGTARAGKETPTGNFQVRTKQKCPQYFGADGTKNIAGCSAENPLGPRALWWQDTMYGLHGTSSPALIAEGTSANGRRVSAGCVRNHNDNITWLYDQVTVGTPIKIYK